jgi:hypothetical protein
MAEPILFPDQPRSLVWGFFLGGIALSIIALIKIANTVRLMIGIVIIAGLAWYLWPRDVFNHQIPGFTAYAVVRIYDTPELKRKYLFDLATPEGAKAAFYLSASDIFTFAVTDIHGEMYPLEVKLGRSGIPIDAFIVLICQVGIDNDKKDTVLRVLVNGSEIRRRSISAVLELGNIKQIKSMTLFADGMVTFMEMATFSVSLSNEEVEKLVGNIKERLKLPLD